MSNTITKYGRTFTDHKSPFGWYFTAEEEARAWEVCQLADKWFNEHFAAPKRSAMVRTRYYKPKKDEQESNGQAV